MKTKWPAMHASGDNRIDRINRLIESSGLAERYFYYGRNMGEHTWWLSGMTPIGIRDVLKYLAKDGVDVAEFKEPE